MSDTDDTDLLLLIPPNFFFIQSSDSEDEFRKTYFSRDKNEIERAVVNDLVNQVNELESRVCAIESSDGSCSLSFNGFCNQSIESLDLKNAKFVYGDGLLGLPQMPSNSQLSGSLDNVCRVNNLASAKGSIKSNRPFSLPSTPKSAPYKQQPLSAKGFVRRDKNVADQLHKLPNLNCFLDLDLDNNDISYSTGRNACENISYENHHSEGEVNKFVNGISGQSKNIKMEGELISQLNDKLRLNANESGDSAEAKNSNVENKQYLRTRNINTFDKNASDKCENHLELSEVDKLLQEMEETQSEIEKKLKFREMQYNISKADPNCVHIGSYNASDTINNADVGYSTHTLFYHQLTSETSNNDLVNTCSRPRMNSKVPEAEELFTHKKLTALGHSIGQDNDEVGAGKYTTPLSSPLTRSPYKHDRKITLNSCVTTNDQESPLSRFRKKINFGPSKDIGMYLRSPSKFGVEKEFIETTKEDRESQLSFGLRRHKSLDDNSSADDEEKKKFLSRQRSTKSKVKNSRVMRDFDKRYSRNPSKSNFRFDAEERALNLEHGESRGRNLMSLSDLWNSGGKDRGIQTESDPVKLSQKLEEEKYKRQHCEQEIHELQKRVLDDQERLAVALQVDKEKDLAIKKLWNGWQQLASHWTELEEQRHALSKQLEGQTKAYDAQAEDIRKKVDRWEKELSKALDLAAGYKEKCSLISQEREEFKIEMEKKMQETLNELASLREENAKYTAKNNQLIEKLNDTQSESDKIELCERLQSCLYFMRELDRQLVSEYQKKLIDVEQKLNDFEAEISTLREQKENLSLKLQDELNRIKAITEQKLSLQKMIDDYKKQEKILKDEVRAATERLELARVELRALYQGQLEAVVKEKLREFQSQLNAAEAALRAELLSREKELAERAAQQCHTLAESHKIEIAGLEERYKSQLKTLVNKMQEMESQKTEAELKLKHETDRRTEIAQKLHSVMETQWRQALNIISSTAASGDAKSQMEWTGQGDHDDMRLDLKKINSDPNSASSSNNDSAPFNKSDGLSTYRLAPSANMAASADTKGINNAELKRQQQHLKKYIQMLLDRTPGNPVPDTLDQTSSTLGTDDMHLNSSNITNDSFFSENQSSDINGPSKEKDKLANRQRGLEKMAERRQQLQNINRILKHQPWK